MNRMPMINEVRKCLKCVTYHSMNKNNCPSCGRFLYPVGVEYQPKVVKRKVTNGC